VNEKDLKTKYLRSKNREFTVFAAQCFNMLLPFLIFLLIAGRVYSSRLERVLFSGNVFHVANLHT
jgi:flagellar biosynthesis protein FlhB